jgi:hypothetical protein
MTLYRVLGKDLKFKIGSVICVSGEDVELRENDPVVGAHVAEGTLVEYKQSQAAKSLRQTKKERTDVIS